MPATHLADITDTAIDDRLTWIDGAQVEWTGHMPADAEQWNDLAARKATDLTASDVRAILERHDIVGDGASEEIDMAISMAAEPEGLSDNAVVVVRFG